MPIIFVHGVNVRKSPGYDAQVKVTSTFLKKYLAGATIQGKTLPNDFQINFPYWGDMGTKFAWDMASLPKGDIQALGGTGDPSLRAVVATLKDAVEGDLGDEPLTALAKKDFRLAVEVLASLIIETPPQGKEEEVARFAVAIQTFAADQPSPSWLSTVNNDEQLIGNLKLAIDQDTTIQAQGLGDVFNAIGKAARRLKDSVRGIAGKAVDKAGDFASSKLLGWTREPLNENLGRFFGDVFIYFDGRGDINAPGRIPALILDAFDTAAQTTNGEPLVIIGHSLGGVISFDLLSHYRPNLNVDLFVSVGSQVSHFEEIKLFHSSDKNIGSGAKASTPPNIKHWINVFDTVDIFSYACDPIFNRVDVDAEYDTNTYVVKSHSEYFKQARFYERLRARIDTL